MKIVMKIGALWVKESEKKKIDANAWVFFSESLDGDVKKRKILRFQPERDPLMYALPC